MSKEAIAEHDARVEALAAGNRAAAAAEQARRSQPPAAGLSSDDRRALYWRMRLKGIDFDAAVEQLFGSRQGADRITSAALDSFREEITAEVARHHRG